MHTCDCNLFQFCFNTAYLLPESSPGLLRGQFFKLFGQLLSEKGDMIVVIAMRLLPKAVFRMRLRTADQRSENNEQRKRTMRLHVGTTLNFHALESLFVEEFGIDYLSCYLHGHVQPAVMRGWTTGATRCQSKLLVRCGLVPDHSRILVPNPQVRLICRLQVSRASSSLKASTNFHLHNVSAFGFTPSLNPKQGVYVGLQVVATYCKLIYPLGKPRQECGSSESG